MKKYVFFLLSVLAVSGCANITPYNYYNKSNYRKSVWKFIKGYKDYKKNEIIISLSYKNRITNLLSKPDTNCYIAWSNDDPGPLEPENNYRDISKYDSSEAKTLIQGSKKYYTYNINTVKYDRICDDYTYEAIVGTCPGYNLLKSYKDIGILFSAKNGEPIKIVTFGRRLAFSGYGYTIRRTNCKFHLEKEKFIRVKKYIYYNGYEKSTGKLSFKEIEKNGHHFFTINPPYKNTRVELLSIYSRNLYHKAYLYIKGVNQNGEVFGKVEIKNGVIH